MKVEPRDVLPGLLNVEEPMPVEVVDPIPMEVVEPGVVPMTLVMFVPLP